MLNPHQTRRTFLLGSTALALASFVLSSRNVVAQEQFSFENPVAIPPIESGTIVNGVRVFDLKLQNGKSEFFKGLQTDTSGINGSYLGPILRMRTGESIRMRVANALGHASTLHWHGMNVPAKADGGPHQSIPSGETWSPEFMVKNAASTMWYHSHQVNETGSQVWAGLAGLIIIDDDVSDKLNLPSTYGVDDLPLVLQDRRFNSDGSMPYDISMHDEMMGMQGNVPLINGTVLPYFKVTSEKLRIRLLNGANASIYNLAFADGRAFAQIASDGGLLAEPVTMTGLRLAPGERAEIIVDFGPNQTVLLQSVAGNVRAGRGMGQGMGMMMGAQSPEFDLIEFRTTTELKPTAAVPAKLANLPDVSASDAVRTRKFLLEMSGMGPMRMLGMGGTFTINGNGMNMERIDEVVKIGETEIWQITNAGPMIHPFHVHNTQFRILDRDGRPTSANESGLKDTVVINPDETVQLLVRFDNHTDTQRPYMYHCHILEHEDAGMMGQFTVV
jgi:blue copper oxidase